MTLDISSIKNYDPQAYAEAEQAFIEQTGKTAADFENRVLELTQKNEDLTGAQILDIAKRENLPNLPNPVTKPIVIVATMLPSLGALAMSAITDSANQQRKATHEQRVASTQALVASMEKEAKNTRTKAITQLVMGIVSGAVTIGAGLYQGIASGALSLNSTLNSGQMMAVNNSISGYSQALGGVGKLVDSGSQFAGSWMDAKNIELRADQEQVRIMRERAESLDQSMKEVIQKSNQALTAIAESTQQMRQKVLA